MKRVLLMALTASLMSSAAMAFEITGGSLVLTERGVDYTRNNWQSYGQTETKGAISYSFGNGFGGQTGLSIGTFGGENGYKNLDLHLTYALAANVTLGAFVGNESYDYQRDFGANNYTLFGAEAAYTQNALSVQTALVFEHSTNGYQYSYRSIVLDGVYELSEKVNVTGGLHFLKDRRYNAAGNTYQYAYVGAKYAMTSKIDLDIVYGTLNVVDYHGERNLSLSLTYKFRSPEIFQSRGFNTLLPGA